jgi:DNA-binding MarR family transcriptional regulator
MSLQVYLTHPGFLIRRCNQTIAGMFAEFAAPYGVTQQQLATLHAVSEYPGLDQGEIAELIALDRSTIGTVVQKLVARGLLSVQTTSRDRRAKILTITDAGLATKEQLLRDIAPIKDRFLQPLSPSERIQFLDMLQRLAAAHNATSRVQHTLPAA